MKSAIQLVPYEIDLLATVAQELITKNQKLLPDLTQCHIFVTDMAHAPALRRSLINAASDKGFDALLGPSISTLEIWLSNEYPVGTPILNQAAQELILVEAIRTSQGLFNTDEPWALTTELLTLFDELTRANCKPDKTLENFQERLALSYQLENSQVSPFQRESRIVYTLWKAWHEQLEANDELDSASAEFIQLQKSLSSPDNHRSYWFAGLSSLTETRSTWLKQLCAQQTVHIYLHGNDTSAENYHPDLPIQKVVNQLDIPVSVNTPITEYSKFLDAIFARNKAPVSERSHQFAKSFPNDPFHNRLRIYEADNPEQEARALDIQIRTWLLDGKESIGILTEDRRLARRLRALLERAGIELVDGGGWALSTTSAAAVIERWLETVEQDFAYASLLDTLKSPFVCLSEDREKHLLSVRRLEQDIIVHENIASGLKRYQKHLGRRAKRLIDAGIWVVGHRKALEDFLSQLELAAEPFSTLLAGEHPAASYTDALKTSLKLLGALNSFESDAAGQRLLQEIEMLHTTASKHSIQLSWQEFRGWLGQTLERYTYKAAHQSGPVQLYSLAQGRHMRFSALIIAGCTAEHLPGASRSYAFFNQSVRSELGLRTHAEQLSLKLHDFRHALEAAPEVLLTVSIMKEGDPVIPSPWLIAVKTFHELSYRSSLAHLTLKNLVNEPAAYVQKDKTPLPDKQMANPSATLPISLMPARWSASMHQNLINCPFKFFASNGLKLQAQEEIRLALAKADYGSLIHRILQAFHGDVDRLPGPWKGPILENTRSSALELLNEISMQVFNPVIGDNFHARSWLEIWLQYMPMYINWQMKHSEQWAIHKTEQQLETTLNNNVISYGRVDRIDSSNDKYCVLDYKTGATPKTEDVLSGEAVQLPNYALLSDDEISEIAYVQINNRKVSTPVCISGEDIQPLLNNTQQRLNLLTDSISKQATLTAWGDNTVCRYCEIEAICRRESWSEENE